jgi:hypothetical protein
VAGVGAVLAQRRHRRARRRCDVERGIPIDPKVGLVTFHEAAEDMLNDYKANRKRTYVDAKRRINSSSSGSSTKRCWRTCLRACGRS